MAAERHLDRLREFLTGFFRNEPVRVLLFGSRARGDHAGASDIDIGILPAQGFDPAKLASLDEEVDRLNIPYKVEIVNLAETSQRLRAQALKDGIIWKD